MLSLQNNAYICIVIHRKKDNRHIGESVFALSLTRNLAVSMDVRMTTAPSLVLDCVFSTNDTGVGIVSVYLHPGLPEPLVR